jgi:hypothetical protein
VAHHHSGLFGNIFDFGDNARNYLICLCAELDRLGTAHLEMCGPKLQGILVGTLGYSSRHFVMLMAWTAHEDEGKQQKSDLHDKSSGPLATSESQQPAGSQQLSLYGNS